MSKLNTEAQVIEGVNLFYVKLQKPSLKYQSQTDKEFSVTVQVDKATKTLWNIFYTRRGFVILPAPVRGVANRVETCRINPVMLS